MTVTSEEGTAVHGGEHVVHQDRSKKQHSQVRQRPSRQPALPADMRAFPGIQVIFENF